MLKVGKNISSIYMGNKKQKSKEIIIVENTKYLIIFAYIMFILLSSFLFNTPRDIIMGMKKIILSPSILLTDYMKLANIGSALFNSSLLMLISLIIARINKISMKGPVIAAIFTIGGFGLFGKNIYNIWPIFLGVYLYSFIQGDKFNKYIITAFFGTALGPLVSQISFGLGLKPFAGILLGNLGGLIVGIILPPLASHFFGFHKGYNLYNLGFTAGIVGTLFMSLLRGFGFENNSTLIVLEGKNLILSIYFFIYFASMILVGWLINGQNFKGYKALLKDSGRATSDFISQYGFSISLINMGILGILSISYILLVKGQLSGLVIGGVFTVVGFGAFGKHPKNTIPIVVGVYIASIFKVWKINSAGILLAALFGTTLAPISGTFGWKAGILAGFLHVSIVSNTGYLHGGMNLYNNGFAGGIVAAILVPVMESFRKGTINK